MIERLRALEFASEKRAIPILGSVKGAWLYEKVCQMKPTKVLELGTANGYSGCILGSTGAQLLTIELNAELAEEARRTFAKFNITAEVINGDAAIIVKELTTQKEQRNSFDLVFIDFAKKKYRDVLDSCLHLVKPHGLIIADNISFIECQDFKKAVLNHPQLRTEIIQIKDGLSCSERLY